MRLRFDQLGKEIGQSILGSFGPTVAQDGISPETQYADLRHEPDPAHTAKRKQLGLLSRLTSIPCLLELYARAPSDAEFRACLGKHITFWQRHSREADAAKPLQHPAALAPFLWVIAAGTPVSLISKLALTPARGWPAGVYLFGGNALRVGLVAANQLPRDRSTLLVRLMAAGPLLQQAIVELSALPADAYERTVADPILLRFHHTLELELNRTPEEEEFLVTMHYTWEQAREEGRREGQELGRREGQELGQTQARAGDVLTVLRVRGLPVSDAERERVLAERDPDRLERWLERAVTAASLAAILDEPS